MRANKQVVVEFTKNLASAYRELTFAVNSMYLNLTDWKARFDKSNHLASDEIRLAKGQYTLLHNELLEVLKELALLKKEAKSINVNKAARTEIDKLIIRRKTLYMRFRVCLSQFAALLTCMNWQSPSIKSSKDTRIGLERSPIIADWNDYKRDRSGDTFYCEGMLAKHILKTKNIAQKPVLNAFNSGMGAFTAIVYFLVCEGLVKNKILVSSQIYVESRKLLKEFFKKSLESFDHNNTDLIVENILRLKPNIVFLEPLSNTNNLRLFDIVEIVSRVSDVYRDEIFFILDVTCILGFENLFDDLKLPHNVKIITHGSILKYSQLGLERINAGFIQTFGLGKYAEKILDYRTLSGTNIQDFATNLLPYTKKEFLQKRLKFIESNAVNLAIAFGTVDRKGEVIAEIVYPGLPSHADFNLSRKIGFSGAFFNIKFISKFNNDTYFELFTKEVIKLARKHNCDIVHGASFGFNHTSVYYSVGWDEPENHYIRISTGTESLYEVEKIKTVLIEAFLKFKQSLFKKKKKVI